MTALSCLAAFAGETLAQSLSGTDQLPASLALWPSPKTCDAHQSVAGHAWLAASAAKTASLCNWQYPRSEHHVELGRAEQCRGRAEATALLLPWGPQMMQGLVGALMAPSPLARVSKVTAVLAALASLTPQGSMQQIATGVGSMGAVMLQWLSLTLNGLPPGERPMQCRASCLLGPAGRWLRGLIPVLWSCSICCKDRCSCSEGKMPGSSCCSDEAV